MDIYEIQFGDLPLEVTGIYYSACMGDLETPPQPAEFEIHGIELFNLDVFELMDEASKLEDIETEILNKYF